MAFLVGLLAGVIVGALLARHMGTTRVSSISDALAFYTVPAQGDVYTTGEFKLPQAIEEAMEGAAYDEARLELARHMAQRAARLRGMGT